ncbi:peptidoglycan-binding protein [Streptomyces huiliensis]|uniref:peptidoglycan-binding protein n=1 Tax=Streptomyces huiliensis TaxID=2876027 RepID=UPI001CC07BEC|nr:peptidoglycan-binding protein [Streptomyces huiliensis]
MPNEPWCDMAVSKWAADSGNADVVGKFAYCPEHVNWFRARGQWIGKNAPARRGDVVFYSWDGGPLADHVGLVVGDSDPGDDIETIEGNTSSGSSGSQGNGDGCYRRTRSRAYVLGFGRPAYAGSGPSRSRVTIGGLSYGYGAHGDHVTRVGRALVARGFGSHYTEGPGPDWSDADTASYAAFQRSLGYRGADADGIPGPDSLTALLGEIPGSNTTEDDDMPISIGEYNGTEHQLPRDQWVTVDVKGVDLVKNASAYNATVYLTLYAPAGATVQGRWYHQRKDGSRWDGPIVERLMTTGSSFVDFTHQGSISDGETARFEVTYGSVPNGDSRPAAITAARVRGVYWKADQ